MTCHGEKGKRRKWEKKENERSGKKEVGEWMRKRKNRRKLKPEDCHFELNMWSIPKLKMRTFPSSFFCFLILLSLTILRFWKNRKIKRIRNRKSQKCSSSNDYYLITSLFFLFRPFSLCLSFSLSIPLSLSILQRDLWAVIFTLILLFWRDFGWRKKG